MNINESSLREYVNNVVKSIMEDVFDSPASAAASRANIKKATKVLGAKSPHTKALTKLHGAMKKSRFVYGIADAELERREIGNYDDLDPRDVPASNPALTPMKGKGFDGYDAIFGRGDRRVKLGVIKKAAAAIRKGRGGKVVSEGAVEKIKRMLGIKPKEENPDEYRNIKPRPGTGGERIRVKKYDGNEKEPGFLDRIWPG